MLRTVLLIMFISFPALAEWNTPVNLGPPIDTADWEDEPTLTVDGSYMVYVSDKVSGSYGNKDLWLSFSSGGNWQTPTNLGSNVNTVNADVSPFLAENDTKLYFATSWPSGGYGGADILWAPISGGVVGAKSNIGDVINSAAEEINPVLNSDGTTIYFASNRVSGSYGGYDIWYSIFSGGYWSTPLNLGANVNTGNDEIPQWVSDDGNQLILRSNRSGTYGSFDLWSSDYNGYVWETPVNLGLPINSPQTDRGCSIITEGTDLVMYISSTRTGSYGGLDIWKSVWNGTDIKSASLGEIKAIFR